MSTEKTLKIENLSTIDYIRQMDSIRNQESAAVEYYGNTISRKQYWSHIEQYRKYFKGIGIKKGEPVTICMVNSPEYEFVFSALLENGSIASTVSKSFINADFKRQTIERKVKTLILSVEFATELAKLNTFAQLGVNDSAEHLERVIFTTAGDYMPEEQAVKYNNQDFATVINALCIPKNIEVIMPGEILKSLNKYSNLVLENENILDEIATYSNTGGTTGAPKCACHTHRAIISLLKSHEREVFPEFDMNENSRSLLVIPISHITSQFYGLLMRRTHGATIVYNPNCFEPTVLRDVLIKENIDDVVLPFGLYYAITRQEFAAGELKLNTPLCGGEPTPYTPTKDVDEKLRKAGSNPIIIGTGSTEFGSGIMASYGEDSRCNESGYFFPYAKGFLLDPKTRNKITELGKRGILYASAPWQMDGYLNDDKATAEFFNYTDADGTVYGTNNDIAEITGYHNEQPIYSMLGRATDFIKTDDGETYYSGSTFKNGMIETVDFEDGSFLFDMRDVMLNVPGVMEAQPIIIPQYKDAKNGYPVVNITIYPGAEPRNILKQVYEHYSKSDDVAPAGIIFRTHFARSLSSDKREVLSLIDERKGYFCVNKNGEFCSVEFSNNGEKIIAVLDDNYTIERVNPPEPKLVFSTIRKKGAKTMPTEKKPTGYPSIDKPWLKYYTEKAINAKTPKCSIYQNIYDGNADHFSDVALLFFGKKITYKQLFAEVDKTAKAFIANGVQCRENVVLCMPAVPETVYAILALNKIGANAVMLNPLFTEEQLIARISETDAKLMVIVNELYGRVEKVIPKTTIKTMVSCAAVNSLGAIVKLIKKAKTIPNTTAWNDFLKQGSGTNLIVPEYESNRPAIMVYSSGTTGASKGIQLTNDSINSTIKEGVQIGFEWQRGDRWFSQIPVWFSTGICAQTLVPLKYGITIILEPIYDFEIFYQHIIKYKPNFMITACGLLDYLMTKQPKAEAYKGFKFLCAGGEYVTPSAEKKYNDWLKSNDNHYGFFKGYGMCECGGTVTASSPKSNAVGSAGIPTPNVVVSAFDLETGKECKYGERGEIRVLTPSRMLGYYKNPDATAEYFHDDEQGRIWACTGDMGYVTEDGSVYVDGRISSSYKNKVGETIYLFDIERAVLDIEQVRQCKVVVSDINGEKIHIAHIVLTADADKEATLKAIKSHCLSKLPANHMPTLVRMYDSALPVAPSGKLNVAQMENDTIDLIEL